MSPPRDVEVGHDVSRVRLESPTTLSAYSVTNRVSEPGGVSQQQLHPRRELQLLGTSRVEMFAGAIGEERGERGREVGGVSVVVQDSAAGDDVDLDLHSRIGSALILCLSLALGERLQRDDVGRPSDVVHVGDAGDVERDGALEPLDVGVFGGEPRA